MEDLNRQFAREDVLMGNENMKICSASSAREEMQEHGRLHCTPTTGALTRVSEGMEESEPSHSGGRHVEGGNRQNRLRLESRTPSWVALWTWSAMPSIHGNDIPPGKPGPRKEEPQGSYLDSLLPKRIP